MSSKTNPRRKHRQNQRELDEMMRRWEERMDEKAAREAEEEEKMKAQEAEKLRQSYLRRTGRRDMRP